MKKRIIATILIILLFLAGLGIVLYPYVSEYVNAKHASRVVVNYDDAVKEITPEDFSQYFEVAEEYNERLRQNPNPFSEDSRTEGYETALNVDGSGMMGYLEIPKISVKLPFYHGTSGAVLNEAVGHLEGSSLPVGGECTHVVLSAHRGLPSAKLFTDLPELGEGDIFILTVLDRKMTYQVDQILTVLPTELDVLEGEDGLCYIDDVYAVWHQYSPASGEGPSDREPAGGRSEEHSGRSRRARAHDTGEDSEVHPVCGDGRRGAVLDRVADAVEEEG